MSKITARFEVTKEGLVMFRFKGTLMQIKKNSDKLFLTYFKSNLKISHSNYL